jgi:hypothetical protein
MGYKKWNYLQNRSVWSCIEVFCLPTNVGFYILFIVLCILPEGGNQCNWFVVLRQCNENKQ